MLNDATSSAVYRYAYDVQYPVYAPEAPAQAKPNRSNPVMYGIDYFFLDAPLTAISSTFNPIDEVSKPIIITDNDHKLSLVSGRLTRWEGLLQLLGLLCVVNEQSVEVSRTSDLELSDGGVFG